MKTKTTSKQAKLKELNKAADKLMREFNKNARYSPTGKYVVRAGSKLLISDDTAVLFDKYKKAMTQKSKGR